MTSATAIQPWAMIVWSAYQPGTTARDGGPRQARQRAAHDDVGVANAVDVDAQGIGRRGLLADGPQVQARSRVEDPVGGQPGTSR